MKKWKIPVGAGYRPISRNGDGNYYVGDIEYAYSECIFLPHKENPGSDWKEILKLPYIKEIIESKRNCHVFKLPENDRGIKYIIVNEDELIKIEK